MARRYRSKADDLHDDFDDFDDFDDDFDDAAVAVQRDDVRLAPEFGPFDIDELDAEDSDTAGRLDFGAVLLPVPDQGTVTVEPTANGRLQAVHVMLPQGRLSVSALAAPRSSGLWGELLKEIEASLREGGARVRSFTGEWGRELHAQSNGASSVFVGVDGSRWMLYGVATGPAQDAGTLDAELRRMLKDTVVVRGRSPYPPRTVLPLSLPEHLKEQQEAEAAAAAAAPAPVQVPVPTRPAERRDGAAAAGPAPHDGRRSVRDLPSRAVPYRAIPYQPGAYPAAANGAPVNGMPVTGTPVNGAPGNGVAANGTPPNGRPGNGAPGNGEPADGRPINGAPVNGFPVNGGNGSGVHGSPVNGTAADAPAPAAPPRDGHRRTGDQPPATPAPPTTGPRRAPEPGTEPHGLPPIGRPGAPAPDMPSTPTGRRRAPESEPETPPPGGRRRAPEPESPSPGGRRRAPEPEIPLPGGRRRAPEPEVQGGRRRAPEPAVEIPTEPLPALRSPQVGAERPEPPREDVHTTPFDVVAASREPDAAERTPRRSRHARPEAGADERTPAAPVVADPGTQPALAFLMGDPMSLFNPAQGSGRHRRPD